MGLSVSFDGLQSIQRWDPHSKHLIWSWACVQVEDMHPIRRRRYPKQCRGKSCSVSGRLHCGDILEMLLLWADCKLQSSKHLGYVGTENSGVLIGVVRNDHFQPVEELSPQLGIAQYPLVKRFNCAEY